MNSSILLIDDETKVLSAIKRALIEEPYTIYTAESGLDGLDILKDHEIKVVMSDEKMPGITGSELITIVRQKYPETIRIILTIPLREVFLIFIPYSVVTPPEPPPAPVKPLTS